MEKCCGVDTRYRPATANEELCRNGAMLAAVDLLMRETQKVLISDAEERRPIVSRTESNVGARVADVARNGRERIGALQAPAMRHGVLQVSGDVVAHEADESGQP